MISHASIIDKQYCMYNGYTELLLSGVHVSLHILKIKAEYRFSDIVNKIFESLK